jgi:hypothetical protein
MPSRISGDDQAQCQHGCQETELLAEDRAIVKHACLLVGPRKHRASMYTFRYSGLPSFPSSSTCLCVVGRHLTNSFADKDKNGEAKLDGPMTVGY